MKFTTPQTALSAAVDRVLNVVPQKTTIPALGHLLLEAGDGRIAITATDLDITISTVVEGDIASPGAVTLPAKRFSEIVRQLDSSSDVSVDVTKSATLITAGRANFRILGMESTEFPKVPSMTIEGGIGVPAETLKKAIQKTVFCVSRDETRRALTGILWEVGKGSMSMVGTDGHRLARISLPVDLRVDAKRECIVPTKALNQIVRLAGDAGDSAVNVKIDDDHVIFEIGRTTLLTRLIEGPFPKYQDVIPKDNDKKIIVNRDVIAAAVGRVNLLADNLTHQVRISLHSGRLVLTARTQDIGEAKEEIETQYEGEEMDMGFNAQYLAEILRNMDGEEILLSVSTPLTAGLVEPLEQGEDENYLCLLMPLRLID